MKQAKHRAVALGTRATLLALLALVSACKESVDTVQTGAFKAETYGGALVSAARPLAVIEGASLMTTQKTTVDHIASAVNGEDCSTLRYQKGDNYCRPYVENKPVVPQLYCYRTLAAVTCYEQPSANPADKLVGVREGGLQKTY